MVTVSNIELACDGNKRIVYADLNSIANNDTWIVPYLQKINFFSVIVSTDDDVSGTVSGKTITFKCGASLAGMVKVEGI